MASKSSAVFGKLRSKLPLRQDADGSETQVEVREDEEQAIKLQEIIDLLVAAGYFRARIKGLSSFDKVVGGMSWCILSCNVDVDVDLLFQENSTIGQKIALTEKIVAVLPKIKCPHRIEPHQIQGLDFIHIFPVIQWLVKRSMEFRHESAEFDQLYAINQFNKDFLESKKAKDKRSQVLGNVNTVVEAYRPHRSFKRKNATPTDILSSVQITLLEYGYRAHTSQAANDHESSSGGVAENQEIDEHQIQQFMSSMTVTEEEIFNFEDLNEDEKIKFLKHYTALHMELKDGGHSAQEMKKVLALEEKKDNLNIHIEKLRTEQESLSKEMVETVDFLEDIRLKQKKADRAVKELENSKTKSENAGEIEELVILNDNLKSQEIQFREHCKEELVRLQNMIEETKKSKASTGTDSECTKELEEKSERIRVFRLQLAKKNRSIAALQRQLDDVPSRAELAQYQRRFLELYNQVSAKHKETKQYYSLYNTLEDTRMYMKRELSLLNSISDNYPEAMLSLEGKDEFLQQLKFILDSVKQSKRKQDARLVEERHRRDHLSRALQGLLELHRKYVQAVRQLTIECRKHEELTTRINS